MNLIRDHFHTNVKYTLPRIGRVSLPEGPALLHFSHGITTLDMNSLSYAAQLENSIKHEVSNYGAPGHRELSRLGSYYTKAGVYITLDSEDITGYRLASLFVDELKALRGAAPQGPPGFNPGPSR